MTDHLPPHELDPDSVMVRKALLKSFPNPMEPEELADQVGMGTGEFNGAIRTLRANGYLNEGDFGIVLVKEDGEPGTDAAEPEQAWPNETEDAQDAESADDALDDQGAAPEGSWIPGTTVRNDYRVTITTSLDGIGGGDPERLEQGARQMETAIADILNERFPGAVIEVDVDDIAVFDQPRSIFARPEDEG